MNYIAPSHPLGPPSVSGTELTVDMMLQQPIRITKMISDLSLQRFIIDQVFSSTGSVSGGAVVYDIAAKNELYTERDVQKVAPGSSFPLITSERQAPGIAEVDKWGGKVFVVDEAKDRNDSASFTNKIRQLTNTIIRKLNQQAINILEASITASSQTMTGNSWGSVVVGGSSQSNADEFPAYDFAHASQLAEEDELGIEYDLWLLNPAQYTALVTIYGGANLRELLAEMGIRIYVSNRVPAGSAYAVAAGQVGQFRVEKPLGTETWRDPDHERTFVQASVRPVMFVDNPFAVLKVTGLA